MKEEHVIQQNSSTIYGRWMGPTGFLVIFPSCPRL